MKTLINVMNSLVKMNDWKVERFDIQHFNHGYGIGGYVGYLYILGKNTLIIREDGSFEFMED